MPALHGATHVRCAPRHHAPLQPRRNLGWEPVDGHSPDDNGPTVELLVVLLLSVCEHLLDSCVYHMRCGNGCGLRGLHFNEALQQLRASPRSATHTGLVEHNAHRGGIALNDVLPCESAPPPGDYKDSGCSHGLRNALQNEDGGQHPLRCRRVLRLRNGVRTRAGPWMRRLLNHPLRPGRVKTLRMYEGPTLAQSSTRATATASAQQRQRHPASQTPQTRSPGLSRHPPR